ncbi:MAG: gamma-glutamylcyclotransferase family protein [Verrucomicrobiota bacterium]
MNTLLFIYGTLKRGCSNHHHMAGQKFVGPARTVPGYHLCDLGGYPAIVEKAGHPDGIVGEVWSIDAEGLERLDQFEGVHEGLYRRAPLALQAPFAGQTIDAYLSVLPTTGRPDIGSEWIE